MHLVISSINEHIKIEKQWKLETKEVKEDTSFNSDEDGYGDES